MKNLIELSKVSSDDLPELYCDMDQVLCNFLKGADKAVGGSFVMADKATRWKSISQTKGFWANLEWMPGGKRLWQYISKFDPHILSAFSGRDPASRNGKLKWLDKYTNVPKGKRHLVRREHKRKFAVNNDKKPNVLIDDYIKNIKEWESSGGIGVHHTNVAKTLGELKRLGFK